MVYIIETIGDFRHRIAFVLFLILVAASPGMANESEHPVVSSADKTCDLTGGIRILHDGADTLDLADVMAPVLQNRFGKTTIVDLSTGTWIWISVFSKIPPGSEWYLRLNILYRTDVYQLRGDTFQVRTTGMEIPFGDRDVATDVTLHRIVLIDSISNLYIHVPKSERVAVFPEDSVELLASLIPRERLDENSRSRQAISYLLLGIFALVVIYNIIFFFVVRDRSYLFYVIYIIAAASYLFSYRMVATIAPRLNEYDLWIIAQLNIPVFTLFYHLFVDSYFRDVFRKSGWQIASISLIVLAAILLLAGVVDVVSGLPYVTVVPISLGYVVILVYSLVASIAAMKKKYIPAISFFVSILPLVIAGVFLGMRYVLSSFGINISNYVPFEYGITAQIIFFSYALASRYQNTRVELTRKWLENESLERLNQEKSRLFTVIAHDLRAPVASLKMTLELLEEGKLSLEQQRSLVHDIRDTADSTYVMLINLLNWAKIQMKSIERKPTVVKMRTLVDSAVSLAEKGAQSKRISVSVTMPDTVECIVDPDQISVVIRNLLSNAVKFTPEGGLVAISSSESDEYFTFSFKDTGVGMSREIMDQLFKNAERITIRGTMGEQGTGLGLLLCKEFVERNGGSLSVTSEIGKGSEFYFTIPKAMNNEY